MIVRRLFPMLSTEDLTRAVAFYGELLGGAETYRFPEKGRRSSSRSGSETRKSGLRLLGPAFRSTVSGCVPRRAVASSCASTSMTWPAPSSGYERAACRSCWNLWISRGPSASRMCRTRMATC
jgi:hypothetical protein